MDDKVGCYAYLHTKRRMEVEDMLFYLNICRKMSTNHINFF